ncbi:GGDEF domain-containing protein [Pseudomonas paeninsulae]|uniref:GGDEF domain-containing protein n=1 Tax=Pseudomonas paeninsulae TaxID=3110772 RepID=UPI00389A8C9C
MLLLPETNLKQACALAERLREKISTLRCDTEPLEHPLTASLGVAQHRQQRLLNEVIAEADSCLYRAKQQGRNRVCSTEQEGMLQQVDSH